MPTTNTPHAVPDRRARCGRDLHRRRTWHLGGVAKDLDPRPFVGELALSNELLTPRPIPDAPGL